MKPRLYTDSYGRLRCSKCHDRPFRCVCGTALEGQPYAGSARVLIDGEWYGAISGKRGAKR